MKFLNKAWLLLLCAGLFFTACEKENIDEIVVTEEPNYEPGTVDVNNLISALQVSEEESLELDCITIGFQ